MLIWILWSVAKHGYHECNKYFFYSLILRHGVGAVSSLRLPWCADDLKEDLLVPSSLIPKDKQDVENILGYANGSEIWRFPLTPAPVESCFKTLVLPKPSSFQKDSNDYFMQLMLKEKFGWYSIYSKKKKGDCSLCSTWYPLKKSSNIYFMQNLVPISVFYVFTFLIVYIHKNCILHFLLFRRSIHVTVHCYFPCRSDHQWEQKGTPISTHQHAS
jgi:hypothetical protein